MTIRSDTTTIAETAIYANLSALADRLAEAANLSAEAAAASKHGKQNLAIGTALAVDDLLSQSKCPLRRSARPSSSRQQE